MKTLAIDTSSKNASIAILDEKNVLIELNNNDEKTHSQKLMPMIDEAFKKLNLSLDDIGLISCSLGPGSFTGVRIGIATAKAFADSRNILVAGVSSLEALAYNLNQTGTICSLIDANNGNLYAGIFELTKNNEYFITVKSKLQFLSLKDSNGNISSKALLEFIKSNTDANCVSFVGDGAIAYKDLIENLSLPLNRNMLVAEKKYGIASGISIAKIGYTKYKNGEYGDSSILLPIYLRKSQAELALEEKLQS